MQSVNRNSSEKGLAMILLLIVLGVVVAGGVYVLSKKPINEKLGNDTNSQISSVPQTSPVLSPAKGNFTKKGNLSLQENGDLFLVWDEPGNPAANVKLKFTAQSICIIGGIGKDCNLAKTITEGSSYVEVEGNLADNKVEVIKLEEQN